MIELVVDDRSEVADGVVALRLRDPSGAELPAWEPGAHVDLVLKDDLVRQYSLCGDPADRTSWRVAVLREPDGRGGSSFVHDTLRAGDTVRVDGPRNHFALEPAQRYVFVAGGIGITPILPMLDAATAAGAQWRLLYGGRTAASMAFADDLRAAHGDRVELRPQDEHGLLDLDGLDAEGTLVYCCGPPPLLAAVEARCAQARVERFAAVAVDGPVGAFEVELASSGTTLAVPADRSVLEVLEDAGVGILSSCREGTCGTCETGVLSGEVDHRDALLTADERAAHDTMFVCVSRAACARLVLDL
ncbi:oxidoreductase [Pseudonocardia sp. KRD-184]|uniref:Oxidoreductase n=1 Tax=Pseudonocardia oceani TaxID=2792013 RepID=A0ABS6U1F3_9PSEU|nr:PDR/VanB family oxidoreductase [Pseudonocardia oceani]MBW0093128.1 oxidoreductase [Pseudonocardia oceani]MBW0098733.1 oxidoreductase [Pseudonocardia oceani]MBW0111438.1 oxidoreductase [Pseudonocardia oceani]MBW0120813.1 oxidoreductase [Pseudonocardia oceani]MBW0126084.1 oxidoreductase [Pseudonocardia oceani]